MVVYWVSLWTPIKFTYDDLSSAHLLLMGIGMTSKKYLCACIEYSLPLPRIRRCSPLHTSFTNPPLPFLKYHPFSIPPLPLPLPPPQHYELCACTDPDYDGSGYSSSWRVMPSSSRKGFRSRMYSSYWPLFSTLALMPAVDFC